MPSCIRSASSKRDLIDIWFYIAQDNTAAADGVLDTIEKRIQRLAEYPEIGFQREELRPGLRSVSIGQYIIFYKPLKTGDGIQLVRVLHGKRNIQGIFRH